MKVLLLLAALSGATIAAFFASAPILRQPSPTVVAMGSPPHEAQHLAELDALVAAYPDFLHSHDRMTLIWKDGTRMALSDGRLKSPAQTIADADIDDIFTWPYPLGAGDGVPATDFDPGRARPQAFFDKMYGDCRRKGVMARLAGVAWVGGARVQFTSVNGADKALSLAARDLEALGPQYAAYLNPIAGTYSCRDIAGTDRISMHGYAAAIDLNTDYGDYWRWAGGAGAAPYRNRVPLAIVRAFEAHGFIWGGRWSHFDTFHFEYRPELILAAQRAQHASAGARDRSVAMSDGAR
jgi:hypothetical protein